MHWYRMCHNAYSYFCVHVIFSRATVPLLRDVSGILGQLPQDSTTASAVTYHMFCMWHSPVVNVTKFHTSL